MRIWDLMIGHVQKVFVDRMSLANIQGIGSFHGKEGFSEIIGIIPTL